ncbi:MAG: type II secretion system F family protein [Sneathiella sp.]
MFGVDDQLMLALVVGGGTLIVTLFLGFAFAGGNSNSADAKRRLSEISSGGGSTLSAKPMHRSSARLNDQQSSIKALDVLVRKFVPKPAELRGRLEKTGLKISIAEYSLLTIVLVILIVVFMHLVYGLGLFLSIPVGVAAGLLLPHWIFGYLGKRRVNKFLKNFPEAIQLMCRGLRAGLPISETIITVGKDSPEPVGAEFRGIADAVRLGRTIEEGLWDVSKRIDLPDFKFLIIAISIQRETGGNLAETLGGLANTLRKRRQIKLKIKAMSSEARASAWIIGSLPFIMFGLIWLANADYIMALIDDSRGVYMLGVGLAMIASGVGVMAKMVRFEI